MLLSKRVVTRRAPSSALLVAVVSLVMGDAVVAGSDELCVMTYNLRYAGSKPPNAWVQRRPVACEMIQRVGPDLIGTQEGLYSQLKDLAADLPDYAWIGQGREGGSRGEFMAVFYRKQRFEPIEFDHFWLSETPDVVGSKSWGAGSRRMVTWVRFLDRATKRAFYLVNTHLDNRSAKAREKGARLILKRTATLDADLPVLLTGDFNAAADASEPYKLLVNQDGFTDTWTTAKRRGDAWSTWHNYLGPIKDGPRIDWILFRGAVTVLSTEIVTFAKDGQYPSDHFPVIARVKLTPK